MSYLDLDAYKLNTTIPDSFVDEIEDVSAGWVNAQIALESSRIDARLAKRYDAPFEDPCPVVVRMWLVALVDVRVWLKRGVNATDEQFQEYVRARDAALAELLEAADSESGLFDLPLRADTNKSGIARSNPRSYSEASPYVWRDSQAKRARLEDSGGGGTSR